MNNGRQSGKIGLAAFIVLLGVMALSLVGLKVFFGQDHSRHGHTAMAATTDAVEVRCPYADKEGAMDHGSMSPDAMHEQGHMDADACCGRGEGHEGCPGHDESKDEGEAGVYTCPMHPEVVSDKPGKCPKCGMNLEIKKPEEGKE